MKKTISLILISVIIFSSFSISFAQAPSFTETIESTINRILNNSTDNIKAVTEILADLIKYTISKFTDIKSSDWYINTVSKLVGIGGIDGYPDSTFKPNNTITRAEFTKALIASLGYNNLPKTTDHWASGYIQKAEEIKLIGKGELKNTDNAISRNEMAKMCANALDYLKEEQVSNREEYKYQIKDFDKIPKEYQDHVLKAYTKGIISGYPDGTFKGNQSLTRAEASSVIIRVLDTAERKIPQKEDNTKTAELNEEDIKRLRAYEIKLKKFLYISFDDMGEESSQHWINAFYEAGLLDKLGKDLKASEIVFLTSNKTVYDNAIGQTCIRGVVRIKPNKDSKEKLNTNKYYEADLEFTIKDHLTNEGWKIATDGHKLLSNWKEVK